MKRYKQRRAGLRRISDVFSDENRFRLRVIHYSCESFYDRVDGPSPRITSIAVRHYTSGQTCSFSIHQVAERKAALDDIDQKYNEFERIMLDEFFEYVRGQPGDTRWVHWNMRDSNYGFAAIEHRYKVLCGEPVVIRDQDKVDLPILVADIYGPGAAPHPKLESLVDLNGLTKRDFMTGAEEAAAFEAKEFMRLHQSTLRKVDLIARLASLAAADELNTASTWRERHGVSIAGLYDRVTQSTFGKLLSLVGLVAIPAGLAVTAIKIWTLAFN